VEPSPDWRVGGDLVPVRNKSDSTRANHITPLGIIATFVALSETVAGLAAIETTGSVQIIFASFAVLFPIFVASLFFAILWTRAYVFYPPQEFGREVDVRKYVDAMRHQAMGTQEVLSLIKLSIRDTLESPDARIALSRVTSEEVASNEVALARASDSIAEKAVVRLQERVLRVDISSFPIATEDPTPELVFPYDPKQDAFSLLSSIYYQISFHVAAYTYGKAWVLQDVQSGQLMLPANVNWKDNHALAASGTTVEQLGLRAGMELRAIPLPES
jgi:hypothetical protein